MVHGLEGSSNAGYIRSMSQLVLEHGFAVHRANMRSCGGTESLCKTMYHAGLTCDTLSLVRQIRAKSTPAHLSDRLQPWRQCRRSNSPANLATRRRTSGCRYRDLDADRSRRLCPQDVAPGELDLRIAIRQPPEAAHPPAGRELPGVYDIDLLAKCKTVYEFDDKITAPSFGFGTADNYYATQSSNQFLSRIQIPTLLIQAKDDPLIPFEIFESSGHTRNPNITLIASEHGGHLGFISSESRGSGWIGWFCSGSRKSGTKYHPLSFLLLR